MLKTDCIHPEILKTIACCGHGERLLIADGNYPSDSNVNKNAVRIYLNLTRGIPKVTDVLKVMSNIISVEKVEVMMPDTDEEPQIYSDFREILGSKINLSKLKRFEFYNECKKEDIKLVIVTGEPRTYANILITIGVA